MEESEVLIVARARKGDTDAFRILVERHSRNVFRLAYRMTRSEQDAEDVVQETFLRVFQNLENFEERASFSTWLYRVAANCSVDWLRRHRKHDEGKEEMDTHLEEMDTHRDGKLSSENRGGDDQLLLRLDVRKRVNAGFAELSQTERTAFVLRHYEGWSIGEIGQSLGLGTNAVKNSIFRAVQKMRRLLAPIAGVTP